MLARLAVLVLALAMVAPSGAIATAVYLCQMDGGIRSACCCDHTDPAPAEPCVRAEPDCCCDVFRLVKDERPPTTTEGGAPSHAPPALAAVATSDSGRRPALTASSLPYRARAPPGTAPPAYALNCAYLI